jgi:UDP:flavonoid glycosyltransferase YjiC (YdhE family)
MRILFTTLPGAGHYRPLMPIAQTARRRGHQVAVCTAASATASVRAYGLDTLVAGRDWVSEQIRQIASRDAFPPGHHDQVRTYLTTVGYPGDNALQMARDVLTCAATWRPDLVVRENTEFGGYLAAEALGIPHVSVGVAGASHGYLDVAGLAPALDAGRSALGLPADPAGERIYAYLHANLTPESYDPTELSIPNARCYRQANPEIPGERLPSWVADLPAALPIVLAAFGTMCPVLTAWDTTVRAVIAGLGELPCSSIVAVGTGKDTEGYFGQVPANVRLVGQIAQPLLLEACDLYITHGGFNSVREALRLAVPMVIIPWENDQQANAVRCAAAGVARVVASNALTSARLRSACLDVMSDDGYRRNAGRLRREYLTMATTDDLVSDLGELAARTPRIFV